MATIGSSAATEHALVGSHFVMQADRPAQLRDVEIAAMDPFLRCLLFTDGTVTRALGVQTLSPVVVEVVSQAQAPLPDSAATCLGGIEASEDAVHRLVTIGIGAGTSLRHVIWAESYLLPRRLPPGFLRRLDSAPDGIGESLQRGRLESWRELLWFGLGQPPEWAEGEPDPALEVLSRLYRVTTEGSPAMLISEKFAVERRGGIYSLAGC